MSSAVTVACQTLLPVCVTAVSHINNSFNFYNLSVNYMLHSNLWIFLDVLKDFGLILCYALLFCSVLIVKVQT